MKMFKSGNQFASTEDGLQVQEAHHEYINSEINSFSVLTQPKKPIIFQKSKVVDEIKRNFFKF